MSANLELKSRIRSPERAHTAALSLGIQPTEVLIQSDVYFAVPHGRLKLRRIEGKPAELIQYDREDAPTARWSSYDRLEVHDPDLLEAMLRRVLGVRGTVKKRRTLFLYGPARIHLDDVEGLGSFLEFELVETGEEEAGLLMEQLRRVFSVEPADIIGGSYIDMIEKG